MKMNVRRIAVAAIFGIAALVIKVVFFPIDDYHYSWEVNYAVGAFIGGLVGMIVWCFLPDFEK